jgi:general secretion pathway protein L
MSRVVGIDVTPRHVRAVLLRVAYRKTVLEDLREVECSDFDSVVQAIAACTERLGTAGPPSAGAGPGTPSPATPAAGVPSAAPTSTGTPQRVDGIGVVLDGRRVFVHHLPIPVAGQKQIDELLPFEIEAQVPVDIDELVFDYEIAPVQPGSPTLDVLTVSARTEHVRERIALVREALGREPDSVGCGPIELSQLATLFPALSAAGPLAIVDLGEDTTDVCVLESGRVAATRSLSLGTSGFPKSAEALVAQLRQTFGSYALSSGRDVGRVYVVGSGASLEGVSEFFGDRLAVPFVTLPESVLEATTPSQLPLLPRFARALGAAQHVARGRGINLRRGELAFQRGFGFLKEKAPLLMGLGAAVLISFVFATWAETRALDREREMLVARLEAESQAVFGTATSDPEEVDVLLQQAMQHRAEDPMPHFGGLSAAVAVSEAVAPDIVHDVEELDLQKGKLTLRGIVSSTEEAQRISKALEEHRCLEQANISKITQVVNSNKEKYVLEANVRCPEDQGEKKKAQN